MSNSKKPLAERLGAEPSSRHDGVVGYIYKEYHEWAATPCRKFPYKLVCFDDEGQLLETSQEGFATIEDALYWGRKPHNTACAEVYHGDTIVATVNYH